MKSNPRTLIIRVTNQELLNLEFSEFNMIATKL